jgi:hypothetical protein
MNLTDRYIRLDRSIAEGAADEGESFSLMGCLAPECTEIRIEVESCPTELMPEWFAHITCWIDDVTLIKNEHRYKRLVRIRVPSERRRQVFLRFSQLIRESSKLTANQWEKFQYHVRTIAIKIAMDRTSDPLSSWRCAKLPSTFAKKPHTEILRLPIDGQRRG